MSGKCYTAGVKDSIWASEWDNSRLQDCASDLDKMSLYSDTTDDQNRSDTTGDVKERMKSLFESQLYTDVTFYQKNNRKVSISAHRAILAVGSPLFTNMLFGKANKDTAGMKMEVEISNISFGAFTNIVKYLYTDEVFFESDSLVQDILLGAREFGIPSLVDRCKEHFETVQLTTQNVCTKLQMGISHKISVLKERCIEFIQANTLHVINSADFQKCSPSTVRTICNLQSLNLKSESQLLRGIINWAQAQPQKNRKQTIETLLKCVRFLTFTVDELGEAIKTYPDLLTAEDGLKIMMYLYNPPNPPNFSSLPSWCNKNSAQRCSCSDNQGGCQTGPPATKARNPYIGRVTFPLKGNNEQKPISQLTSLLQMKCISGRHIIKALTLSFQPPVSKRSMIGCLSIKVHVHPSDFKTLESVQICSSESVRVEFTKAIKARLGDLVDIEVDASQISFYRFLAFDESIHMTYNPHFQCSVTSRPKEDKMFLISEVEYGPQSFDRQLKNKGKPNNNKSAYFC